MQLIHTDGRTQTVQDAAFDRHQSLYARAGWSVDAEAVVDEPDEVAAAIQEELRATPPLKATKAKQ